MDYGSRIPVNIPEMSTGAALASNRHDDSAASPQAIFLRSLREKSQAFNELRVKTAAGEDNAPGGEAHQVLAPGLEGPLI